MSCKVFTNNQVQEVQEIRFSIQIELLQENILEYVVVAGNRRFTLQYWTQRNMFSPSVWQNIQLRHGRIMIFGTFKDFLNSLRIYSLDGLSNNERRGLLPHRVMSDIFGLEQVIWLQHHIGV
jgi:hypothetical protein